MLTNNLKFSSLLKPNSITRFIVLVLISLCPSQSVLAQGIGGIGNLSSLTGGSSGGSGSSGNGNLAQLNQGTTVDIRANYFKRFPFARAAAETQFGGCDQVTSTPPVSSIGTGSPPPAMPMTIRAYDSCIKPIGYLTACIAVPMILPVPMLPGHYLLGACMNHMPQYTNPQEYPAYEQPYPMYVSATLPTARDNEIFKNQLTTFGIPMSDTQFQLIDRENKQRLLELLFDPERWMWMYTAASQLMFSSTSNSFAGMAGAQFQATANQIVYGTSAPPTTTAQLPTNNSSTPLAQSTASLFGAGMPNPGALVNVANENAATPTYSNNPNKTVSQAVYMVQRLYKMVFVPMAVLFLLPGAVLTQMKVVIAKGFNFQADDVTSPFEGIIRVLIAVFLIPATQLIISYSIDIGNSMAYTVAQWVDINNVILPWANQMTYNTSNTYNTLAPASSSASGSAGTGLSGLTGGGGGGSSGGGILSGAISGLMGSLGSTLSSWISSLVPSWAQSTFGTWLSGSSGVAASGGTGVSSGQPKGASVQETTSYLSAMMQLIFNVLEWFFSQMLLILGAFQLVYMCYLFLMGPISAAFFAWPTIQSSSGVMFRNVFAGWVTAVITVSLWRFYWMVILAIMSVYAADQQGVSGVDIQWDIVVFICFLGLMLVVPFNPFSFDPGNTAETTLYYGSQLGSQFAQDLTAEAAGTSAQGAVDQFAAGISAAANEAQTVGNTMYDGSVFTGTPTPQQQAGLLPGAQGGQPAQSGQPAQGGQPAQSGQTTSTNLGNTPPATPPPSSQKP